MVVSENVSPGNSGEKTATAAPTTQSGNRNWKSSQSTSSPDYASSAAVLPYSIRILI